MRQAAQDPLSNGLRAAGASSGSAAAQWGRWRCVVKPRMIIRASASIAGPLHEKWPRGLMFGDEVEGRELNGWVQLRKGGFGLIRHPDFGVLLEQVGSQGAAKASSASSTTPSSKPSDFRLDLEALQGRWRHSVAKMGVLTVKGHDIIFDIGKRFSVQERPGGVLDMGGWLASPERSSGDRITWVKAGDSGELTCSWDRCLLTPVLFWGICDVKFDPQLPARQRVRVLELGDGRASKFSHHGSAITDTFDSKYCMHPVPIKRSVMVDNKKLTHDMFELAGATHLRPLTYAFPRCYSPELASQLISSLELGDGDAAVLKLCNRSRGAGVVVVSARTADSVLRRLLRPPQGAELQEWLQKRGRDAVQDNMEFSDMLEEHCLYWWSNECPVFVAERCCHSAPVPLDPGSKDVFDGTMRVAFALHRDGPPTDGGDGPFEISWLGGYWKLPQAASTAAGGSDAPEDLHDRIVSSFNSAEKRTAAVPAGHLQSVYDALTPFLPQIFDAGALGPELIASVYREQPVFHAFALSRSAASTRTYDLAKARKLFQKAKTIASDAIGEVAEGTDRGLHERSVLSYVERNLGVCSAMEGDWAEAHEYWERAIQLFPTNSTAIYLDGCYWQVTGNYQRGADSIRESIALDPDFRLAYIGLSECHLLNGEFQLAIEACEACLRRFPEASGAQLNIGQALYKMLLDAQEEEGTEDASRLAARAVKAFELARSKSPDQWSDAAEDMLKFCKADEAHRRKMIPRDAFVSKVYGWRP